MSPEGSAELEAPHKEGEYFVAIMLNGLGFAGMVNTCNMTHVLIDLKVEK